MNTINNKEDFIIEIRPYTRKELCTLYAICNTTLKKYLHPFQQEIQNTSGRVFSAAQIEIIFDKLGFPSSCRY